MASERLCFFLVGEPWVILPHGVTGARPGVDLPSPPPCGWSTGFMTVPRTVGLMPRCLLRPALPHLTFWCDWLPTTPDGGPALRPDPAALAAGEPERHQFALARRKLGARPGAARELRPAARFQLHGVHHGTDRDAVQGKRVAHVHLGIRAALHDRTYREVARGQDVALLAVVVVEQCYVGGAVGIVLDRRDRRWHAVLAPLEVYETVAPLVPAADVAGGDAAVVVAPAGFVQLGGKLLLRLVLRHRVARQNRGVPAARAGRPVASRRHSRPPRTVLYGRHRPASRRPSSRSACGPA